MKTPLTISIEDFKKLGYGNDFGIFDYDYVYIDPDDTVSASKAPPNDRLLTYNPPTFRFGKMIGIYKKAGGGK